MRLLTGCIFIVFFYSCVATKQQSQTDSITAINYIVRLPLVQGDRQYFDFADTTPIFYYEDLIAYYLPYTFDSSKNTYHIKSDTISYEHILTETRYNYFVYKQGSRNGIWYRSIDQLDSYKIISVDSILERKSAPINLQLLIFSPNDTLIEKVIFEKGENFIEKYIAKTKPDESYYDTALLYYTNPMKTIQFSLSPILDSLKKAKLYKLRLAFNESYSQKYSITMPRRDIIYEIQQIKLANSEKPKALFRRFKEDEKRLL